MSAEYHHILLSDENMKSYGFSRYHFPGEADIEDNIWHRNIGAISVKGKQTPVNYINIPESLLIPLSLNKGNRLIDLPAFSIQQNFKDILPMKLLCERAGWNQTEEDLINFLDIQNTKSIRPCFIYKLSHILCPELCSNMYTRLKIHIIRH